MFRVWLLAQCERVDDVGRFAISAAHDPALPSRLFKLLRRFPEERKVVKTAHAEWRAARKAAR